MKSEAEIKAQARVRARRYYEAHKAEVLRKKRLKYDVRGRPTDEDRRAWREAGARWRAKHREQIREKNWWARRNAPPLTEDEKETRREHNREASRRYRLKHREEINARLLRKREAERPTPEQRERRATSKREAEEARRKQFDAELAAAIAAHQERTKHIPVIW